MWRKIKNWCFINKEEEITIAEALKHVQYTEVVNEFLEQALERYCEYCDRFFDYPEMQALHKDFEHTDLVKS